ncbi:5,10-methylene tetrahydromethanopterin reductase [Chimaeribacter californicus]|uniref:5,10-methylene tetrahydromethanopterin reductase n=1 Tax=Chimaeribacter californicus TaxID=2060067 RepID=A0A2N5DW74_9GAMM|nr:LLM class flavin-dependent oxidoreductase [Chimaeribacter californicus]PLR31447.1 5,10-methylene tetrahydromethanopterin reductase [Chimaeribacter californicus]
MKKPFILFGFMMNVVGHLSAGLWRHPDDQATRYTDINYWISLARLLDDAGFDALFLADALGQLDVYQQLPDAALRGAAQMPVNDPLLLVSALAAATRHLGFGITVSTTYEQPYLLARKFTTLDHLSNGRVAWNIVTSMLDSAARNLGMTQQIPHDERYARAQEFVDVTCKLWEGSWEADAVTRDKLAGIYSNPQKVHAIGHHGRYYQVPDAHLSEPSPQRTPVLFQAGTSARGSLFAAVNAEVVFMAGLTPQAIRTDINTLRQLAAEQGRDPASLRFIAAVTVVTGADDRDAQARYQAFQQYISQDAALALFSAWTGVDWSAFDLDRPLEYIETEACRSALASLTRIDSGRQWTLREAADTIGIGGLHPTLVGGPQAIADQLEQFAEEAGVDGFNIGYAISPGSFEDFVRYVVPVLKARGRMAERPAHPLTLRERLFGAGQRHLPADHPASHFRRPS